MAVKDYLKKIGIHTCIYYTVATFFLLFLYFVLNRDLSVGLQVLPQICILPFALLFAIANVVFKYASFSVTWRVVLHYALTLGGSMLCLYLPNKDPQAGGNQALVLFIALSVLYAVIMGVILGLRARIKRVTRDATRYTGLYRDKKKAAPQHAKNKAKSNDKEQAETDKNGKKRKNAQKPEEYQSVFKKK